MASKTAWRDILAPSLQPRLGPIFQVVRLEAVLDQFAIVFLVANHDRARVHFDNLPFDAKVLDKHVIAVS